LYTGKNSPPPFPAEKPWGFFNDFIESTDRFAALDGILNQLALPFSVVRMTGGKKPAAHFFIAGARQGGAGADGTPAETRQPEGAKTGGRDSRQTVLVAHYDSVEDSPGANDNAAAVFMLLETALKLRAAAAANWLIILTDKEELDSGESLRLQGSFQLARFFREQTDAPRRFFIFDTCGTGNTLIISTTAGHLLKQEGGSGQLPAIRKNLEDLRKTAIETAKETMLDFLLLPTPFSDDAGFLRAGLAAQLITVLPAAEASEFAYLAKKDPRYINALVNMNLKKNRDLSRFPETWRVVNTPHDHISRLTPEHFSDTVKFAAALCK
jgi:hypothetical protein